MNRTISILILAAAALGCQQEKDTRRVTKVQPTPLCTAAVLQGAASEVRIFVLGIGFPKSSTDFETNDVDRTCGGFTTFQNFSGSSGKASLVTGQLRLASGSSLPGLTIDTNQPCPFQYSTPTLSTAASYAPAGFSATRYVVVVGPEITTSVSAGCSAGTTIFVPSGFDSSTLAHELGHSIGGLDDEYDNGGPFTGSTITSRNCSLDPMAFFNVTATRGTEGCDGYGTRIYRPTRTCRMFDPSGGSFCRVCSSYIQKALDAPRSLHGKAPSLNPAEPWADAHRATKGLEVVAVLEGSSLTIVSASAAPADSILPQVITGDWFVIAKDGSGTIVAIAPIPSQGEGSTPPGRVYPGKPGGHETPFQPAARLIRFTLVGLEPKDITGKNLELRVVQDSLARRDFFVTNEVVAELLDPKLHAIVYGLQTPLEDYLRKNR